MHEPVSAVRCLGISPISETHGFNAKRRSLTALPREQKVATFGPTFLYLESYPLTTESRARRKRGVRYHHRHTRSVKCVLLGPSA